MRQLSRITAVLAVTMAITLAASAVSAHPDHAGARADEMFNGEGVADDKQHGPPSGHLPPTNTNVRVIGKAGLAAPPGTNGNMSGRVADVAAYGNYAFLTAFRADDCVSGGGGAWIVDIADPANPFEVGFLPTTAGNYAGEGAQVVNVAYGPLAGHQLFIHQNETCPGAPAGSPGSRGGINIWDVTDPLAPALLAAHAGDTDGGANPNTVHSAFAWNSHVDGRLYVVLVDNEESNDVDIMDITNPGAPLMVNDGLDLWTLFGVQQSAPSNLTSVFNHDMVVSRKGGRYVMNVNYWDGGYVLLDVTDPTPGNVSLIAETDYAALDEERLARGHEISPEGNSHQSEFAPNFNFLIGTDEDFNPYRVVAEITSGPYAGVEYIATSASGTPAITAGTSISGTPSFVGMACDPLPAGSGIALVERGVCSFQTKLDNITAAGYSSGVVFNAERPDCLSRVTMLASGAIPFVFVDRLTGLQLLQVAAADAASACSAATPPPGTASASTTIEAIFDGWGYVRLFRTKVPSAPGRPGSIRQLDTYAIEESQSPAYASGFGALSVHEVAMDPRAGSNLAYLSYYAGGFRVLSFDNRGMTEVGAFIDEGGSNFWGVEVHRHPNGQYYVLASDRDYGLYIFQYAGKIRGN